MKAYEGVDALIHIFLLSALVGDEWSISHPGHLTPREGAPNTCWIGGWVDPRAGLDNMEKTKLLPLTGLELWPPGRSARSQSLYQLLFYI
jgi:hypothetical protein